MRTQSIRRIALPIFAAAAVTLIALLLAPVAVLAHPGHDHGRSSFDGRIPGWGDFKRHGKTTYRFLPSKGEYEVRVPGQRRFFIHMDSAGGEEETGGATPSAEEGFEGCSSEGCGDLLPTSELVPICRTSGNRIVVVYSHRPKDTTPIPKETLRSIVRRMNWKIAEQSSLSSNGARKVRMAVDCDKEGNISIYEIETINNEWDAIWNATVTSTGTGGQLFDSPKGGDAIKYLVLDGEEGPGAVAGRLAGIVKSRANPSATGSLPALVPLQAWERHTTIHELFHTLGAVQGDQPPAPPFTDKKGHCADGLDVMCGNEVRCFDSEGFNVPHTYPIDCGKDTYFNAAPKSGTWLAEYWNIAGQENPFLVTMPTQPPEAETGKATSIRPEGVVLNGTVTPKADYAAFYFEYGTTASYGKSAPVPRGVPGWGANPTPVSAGITGLTQQTLYHYRVVAVNDAGEKSYGDDRVFETVIPSATLCKATEENSLCVEGNRYPAGTTIEAKANNGQWIIRTPHVGVHCDSTLKAKTSATAGLPLRFTITSWILSDCFDSLQTANCALTVQAPVEKGILLWADDSPPHQGYDYLGTFTLGGEGNESLRLQCTDPFEFEEIKEFDCTYEVDPEMTVEAYAGYDTHIAVNEFELDKPSGVCPEESSLEIAYLVTSPQPLYVAYGGRAPTAATEAASGVGANSATLEAQVNPQGLETKYHFEYDTAEYKEGEEEHGTSVPISDESIGAGLKDVEVSEAISGLIYGTTYHYRVVATNEIGTTYGKDETFTTKPLTTLCKVNTEGSSCAAASRHPANTTLKAEGEVVFDSEYLQVTCDSTLEGKTSAEVADPLQVSLSKWSFTNCSNLCEVHALKESPSESLPSASLQWSEGANGNLTFGAGEEGLLRIECVGIWECSYKAIPAPTLEGGNPAHLALSEAPLTEQMEPTILDHCPEEIPTIEAEFSLGSPKPVYVKRVEPETTLCKVNTEGSSCAAASRHPANTTLKAEGEVVFDSEYLQVTCDSTLEGKTSAEVADPLQVSLSKWSFTNCSNLCEVHALKESPSESLPSASLQWSEGANGNLTFGAGEEGLLRIECVGIWECSYKAIPAPTLEGGNPAHLALSEAPLTEQMEPTILDHCPEEIPTIEAEFSLGSPKPVYVKRVLIP